MKIVVLDGFTLNSGDLSWDELGMCGELTVYDRTSADELYIRIKDADIILTNKVRITGDMMSMLPRLKYIGVLATGYNVVDVKSAAERNIVVTNVPSYSTRSVAQSVFALLLAITNRVEYYTDRSRKGRWSESPDFCYYDTNLIELAGKRMGIVGLGHIGRSVAEIARAMGMGVYAHTSKSKDCLPDWVNPVGVDELFAACDVISLHCPLTDNNVRMVNARRLKMMKPSSILINTARGGLVDEQALADALNSGKIYAAGVDVLSQEPPEEDNPLLSARNCFITPHISWSTVDARRRLMDIAVENVKAFISGSPQNQIL